MRGTVSRSGTLRGGILTLAGFFREGPLDELRAERGHTPWGGSRVSRGGGAEGETGQEGSGTWALSVQALKSQAPGEPPRTPASHHVCTPRHPRAPRTHFSPEEAPRK